MTARSLRARLERLRARTHTAVGEFTTTLPYSHGIFNIAIKLLLARKALKEKASQKLRIARRCKGIRLGVPGFVADVWALKMVVFISSIN